MGSTLNRNIEYSRYCSEKKEGETPVLRHPQTSGGELRQLMHLGCETIWDAFEYNFKIGRQKSNFIGYRKKIKKDELEKKFTWVSYEEANNIIINFSKGLNVLNLCPQNNLEKEETFRFLGIYSRNKPEWIYSYLGALRDSITIVTIYDTLGDYAVEFILEQTSLTTIVIEVKALKKMLFLAKKGKASQVKNLIVLEKEDDEESAKELKDLGFNILSFDEVVEKGKIEGNEIILNKPKPDTISTINYTSGTSGKPKGAKISHKNIILNTDVIEIIGLYTRPDDIYLSFLPYAHIMETLILAVLISRGVQIGIYNGNPQKILEDFEILKPSGICAVPRIFQRIYDSINNKLNEMPSFKRKIFKKAVEKKIKDYQETGMLHNILLDKFVFKEVRKSLGGRMRFMLVGSAPVDGYLLNFMRCVLSCEIIEGYGQTEDCAGVLLTRTYDPITQHVGGPGYSAELKLVDVPDLNYFSTDIDPETGNSRPRGELCVRGPILFKGYFRDEEKTKEAIDNEGWLHTGDVAMIISEHGNAMRIIDRVKNIFKMQQGEYIAPEKIENIYSGCKYVEQLFIYGDSLQSYLIGILVPNEKAVIDFLKKKNIENVNEENYKDYFLDQDLINDIIKEFDTFGRENDLKGFELPKKIYLSKEKFSIGNHLLTPTLKIRRHEAKKKYSDIIQELYSK